MIFAAGGILVFIDIVTSFSPPEVAIPLLAMIGIVFGVAISQRLEGAVAGLVLGAIMAALAEYTQSQLTVLGISGVEGVLLGHLCLWLGLLLFAGGFTSHAAA